MTYLLRVFLTETIWYDEEYADSIAAFAAYDRTNLGMTVELYKGSEDGTLLRRKP